MRYSKTEKANREIGPGGLQRTYGILPQRGVQMAGHSELSRDGAQKLGQAIGLFSQ